MLPILLGMVLLCATAGYASPAARPQASQQSPNVLLITVDTLRADHLSCYGYHLKTSPNIDRLASEGVRFTRAHTTIPLTGPAHLSLFTSRYPQEHGARINGVATAEDLKWLFLPQVLRRYGYYNAAFISGWPLTSRLTHLDQWFDHYDEDLTRKFQLVNSSRYAEDVNPVVLRWLQQNTRRPFFLWVHYFDPHGPYELREAFANLEESGNPPKSRRLSVGIKKRITKYDSEVAYTDHYIGELLDAVDKLNLRDSTLIVFTADHGESLGEHKYVGHGRHLYENIIHIPLVFRFPGRIQAGKVVDGGVSLVDITPTIVDLALKPAASGGANGAANSVELPVPFGGRSLAWALEGDETHAGRPVRYLTFAGKKGFFPRFLSWLWVVPKGMPLRVGRTEGHRKVVWTPRMKSLRIYDLREDPFEAAPWIRRSKSPEYERETTHLEGWFNNTAIAASEAKLTKEDIEVLKSLGYLQ
jgi:arylsulfatase A-like enzyme